MIQTPLASAGGASAPRDGRRALVSLLLSLAQQYGVRVTVRGTALTVWWKLPFVQW